MTASISMSVKPARPVWGSTRVPRVGFGVPPKPRLTIQAPGSLWIAGACSRFRAPNDIRKRCRRYALPPQSKIALIVYHPISQILEPRPDSPSIKAKPQQSRLIVPYQGKCQIMKATRMTPPVPVDVGCFCVLCGSNSPVFPISEIRGVRAHRDTAPNRLLAGAPACSRLYASIPATRLESNRRARSSGVISRSQTGARAPERARG